MTPKAKPQEDPKCAACGKPVLQRYPVRVELADGKDYVVCEGRGRSVPKLACRRALIDKLRICPGCGEADTVDPGSICEDCTQRLTTARSLIPKDLAWYCVDPSEWVPSTYGSEGWQAQDALGVDRGSFRDHQKDFVNAVCALVATARKSHSRYNADLHGAEVTLISPKGAKREKTRAYSSGDNQNDFHFQATAEQAQALGKVLSELRLLLAEQRLTGRNEGRSLLAGLASGELSISDWTAQDKALGGEVAE